MSRVAAIAVAAVALCPCASAAGTGRLGLMPLPRSALGPGTAALALTRDSGILSNAYAARSAGHGLTAADLAKRGRITGYTLDYVLPNATVPQPRHELLGVQTIAELYRDRSTATRALTFWRGVTRRLTERRAHGVTVAISAFPARVGDGSFAYELTYQEAGQRLYYIGDVVFRSGHLLGAVFVSATDDIGLRARTLRLADSLASRIRRVLAGRIHVSPVPLPGRR